MRGVMPRRRLIWCHQRSKCVCLYKSIHFFSQWRAVALPTWQYRHMFVFRIVSGLVGSNGGLDRLQREFSISIDTDLGRVSRLTLHPLHIVKSFTSQLNYYINTKQAPCNTHPAHRFVITIHWRSSACIYARTAADRPWYTWNKKYEGEAYNRQFEENIQRNSLEVITNQRRIR